MGELPRVVVIGAASIDTKGRARGRLIPATSNPGEIRVSAGGVGRNIAENLGRLGVPTLLLSAVGDDEAGRHILEVTAAGGVDVSQVIVSSRSRSAAYLAVLDEKGAMRLSIDDMAIIEEVTPRYIYDRRRFIRGAKMVVMDANLSPAAIASALRLATKAGVPVCVDPVSVALAPRLKDHLSYLSIITPNAQEAEVLSESPVRDRFEATAAAQKLVSLGVEVAIITLAEEGLCYATSQEKGHIPAIDCEVADATGAGDALTAGVVYGLVNDFPVSEAVRLGVSAATLALTSVDTVCPDLSLERLYDRLVI
ncbi:MAG TPA: ribokinase [Chloroflexi bacterium]|nr:ribokinase [Chloroflexota bacterium]